MSVRDRVIQKSIDLVRVEMWCAWLGVEAGECALVALAAGDFVSYRACRQNMKEWRAALLVVNRLVADRVAADRKGESANGRHT